MLISALAQLLACRQHSRAVATPQQQFPTASVAARSLALQRAWLLRHADVAFKLVLDAKTLLRKAR